VHFICNIGFGKEFRQRFDTRERTVLFGILSLRSLLLLQLMQEVDTYTVPWQLAVSVVQVNLGRALKLSRLKIAIERHNFDIFTQLGNFAVELSSDATWATFVNFEAACTQTFVSACLCSLFQTVCAVTVDCEW